MEWDTALAAENDELAKTLDYAEISEEIATFANNNFATISNCSINCNLHYF